MVYTALAGLAYYASTRCSLQISEEVWVHPCASAGLAPVKIASYCTPSTSRAEKEAAAAPAAAAAARLRDQLAAEIVRL